MPKVQNEPSTGSRRQARPGKPYRLTCSACRKKKQKCDGLQPQCKICQAYGEPCHYDKTPPMTQVLAMASRIEELERMLLTSKSTGPPMPIHDAQEHDSQDRPEYTEAGSQDQRPLQPALVNGFGTQEQSPYYSSTSAVQEPTTLHQPILADVPMPVTSEPALTEEQLQFWDDAAIKTCATLLQMPSEKVSHLLRFHWAWIHPAFMFVHKPTFLRDAATGGPLSSSLLINVICLHSTRFTDRNRSEDLLARCRLLLGQAIQQEPRVTTVQALLQLSAREIGNGSLSQAWLYSGMAFRMAVDMGIFARPKSSPPGSDQAVDDQLAWSCYLWDKAISLYLGRTPTLPVTPSFDPPSGDDLAENGVWMPYPAKEAAVSGTPLMVSHTPSCFSNFCSLATIITEILLSLYAKSTSPNVPTFVQQTKQKLETWRANSLTHLVAEAASEQCLPPHIHTQNLLYHATIILLHRPFSQVASSRSACREAAEAVEHLLLLFEKAFGFDHVTYLIAYSAYTAATVAVLDMHDGILGSQGRVNTYLRALYGIRASCPGIQYSIDIIIKSFDKNTGAASLSRQESNSSSINHEVAALPAFPFDYNDPSVCDWPSQNDFTSPAFGDLDRFALEWSRMPLEAFTTLANTGQDSQMQF